MTHTRRSGRRGDQDYRGDVDVEIQLVGNDISEDDKDLKAPTRDVRRLTVAALITVVYVPVFVCANICTHIYGLCVPFENR